MESFESAVAKEYCPWVTQLRAELKRNKLCLVIGAGVSQDLDFPAWPKLLDLLSRHAEVRLEDVHLEKLSFTEQAEVLFRHFSNIRGSALRAKGVPESQLPRRIKGEWYSLMRDVLYKDAQDEPSKDLERSSLSEMLDVILNSPITLTYNFDDSLERMLEEHTRARRGGSARQFEVLFEGSQPARSQGSIYHVNGYLPRKKLDAMSEDLVFSEEQFGSQFREIVSGSYSMLHRQLVTSTCLFVGVSFEDENLRSVVRAAAGANPGRFHFAVCWTGRGGYNNPDFRQAVDAFYFEVLNLNALFLDNEGIRALGRLLTPPSLPREITGCGLSAVRRYYLVGVPGAGKTTVRRRFGGVKTIPEWLELPPDAMALRPDQMTPEQTTQVDTWVADQIAEKDKLISQENEGVVLVDRSPVDAIAFPQRGQTMAEKAREYYDALRARNVRILEGSIIFLDAEASEVAERLTKKRGSENRSEDPVYKVSDLVLLSQRCKQIYEHDGWWVVKTTNKPVDEVVRKIAQIIYREEYRPIDLRGLIERATRFEN